MATVSATQTTPEIADISNFETRSGDAPVAWENVDAADWYGIWADTVASDTLKFVRELPSNMVQFFGECGSWSNERTEGLPDGPGKAMVGTFAFASAFVGKTVEGMAHGAKKVWEMRESAQRSGDPEEAAHVFVNAGLLALQTFSMAKGLGAASKVSMSVGSVPEIASVTAEGAAVGMPGLAVAAEGVGNLGAAGTYFAVASTPTSSTHSSAASRSKEPTFSSAEIAEGRQIVDFVKNAETIDQKMNILRNYDAIAGKTLRAKFHYALLEVAKNPTMPTVVRLKAMGIMKQYGKLDLDLFTEDIMVNSVRDGNPTVAYRANTILRDIPGTKSVELMRELLDNMMKERIRVFKDAYGILGAEEKAILGDMADAIRQVRRDYNLRILAETDGATAGRTIGKAGKNLYEIDAYFDRATGIIENVGNAADIFPKDMFGTANVPFELVHARFGVDAMTGRIAFVREAGLSNFISKKSFTLKPHFLEGYAGQRITGALKDLFVQGE